MKVVYLLGKAQGKKEEMRGKATEEGQEKKKVKMINLIKYNVLLILVTLVSNVHSQISDEDLICNLKKGKIDEFAISNIDTIFGNWNLIGVYDRRWKQLEAEFEALNFGDSFVDFDGEISTTCSYFYDNDAKIISSVELNLKRDFEEVYILIYFDGNSQVFKNYIQNKKGKLKFLRYIVLQR